MRNILLLFLFAIVFASCNKDNIRVAGVVEGGCLSDGDSVYLMQPDGNNVAKIKGRAVVRDGHFKITGNTSLPALCNVVVFTPAGTLARKVDFIAEGGEVSVRLLPEYYRVAGTPLNDVLQSYRDSMEVASRIYKRYYSKKAETPTLSEMGVKEADDVMAIASFQYRTVLYRAIESNIGNILAPYFIKNNIDIIEPSRGLQFIDKLPAEYKDGVIAYINGLFSAQAKHAPGHRYGDFTMRDIDGCVHTLSSYAGKGKPVVISVWVSGDKKSMASQKALSALGEQYGNEVQFFGISIDKNSKVWRSSVLENSMCGMQLCDLKGWNSAFLSLYGIDKIPYFILLDGDGNISYRGISISDLSASLHAIAKKY